MNNKKKRKTTVAKGVKVTRGQEANMKQKKGSSNVGKYKNVKPGDFAGESGGSSKYSFPINTKARAESALKLAHNAPSPAGIRRAVYARYPSLRKSKGK